MTHPTTARSALTAGASARVRVPASSANLGPGFDCFGLALSLWDECHARVSDDPGLHVRVHGEGAGQVPTDASHLVVATMHTTWSDMGIPAPAGLALECHNAVPHGRGLGSSAAAIVTGVLAAQALAGAVDYQHANDLAARLEGHPDNSSASVFGGFTVSWTDESSGATQTISPALHPDVDVVVFVPDAQLSTARARSVLPTQVRLRDAVTNAAATAALTYALTFDPSLLHQATRDVLHQEPRRGSYPDSMALVDQLREEGHAAVISGAGPAVVVLTTSDARDAIDVPPSAPQGWQRLTPGIAATGGHVVE